MQKLKYGAGSVSLRRKKRKDGTERRYYQGRIYIDGRQVSVYGNTQNECLQKLKTLYAEKQKTQTDAARRTRGLKDGVLQPTTYSDWLDEWIELFKLGKLKPDYLREFKTRVETVRAVFGNKALKDIGALDIQRYVSTLPRANSTVKIFDILNGSLQKAEDVGIIARNPCRALERPTYDKERRRAYELSEQSAMLETLGAKYGAVFFFLCCTGLRVGEFLALSPNDIDFGRHTINVRASVSLKTGHIGKTKTAAAVRKVYFVDDLFKVFDVNTLGGYSYNGIKKAFSKAISKLGFDGISATHSCRHTYASLLAGVGVPGKVIQNQLGHASITTTFDVYTDILAAGESSIYKYIESLKSTLICTLVLI